MDFDEWVILPNEKFLDYHEDDRAKTSHNTRCLFKVNHFMCPSSPPKRFSRVVPDDVVPLPIQLEPPSSGNNTDVVVPSDISLVPCVILPDVKKPISSVPTTICPKELGTDQDSVSTQVFFKKTEQFVDRILDSPKSCSTYAPPQQMELFTSGDQAMEAKISSPRTPRIKNDRENSVKEEIVSWEENSGGKNLWKWSLTGIGAICSFGVAAATICVIIFGSHQRNKQNQKLRFQIYTGDKRIKQVVEHATKLDEAISAVRGVPIQRAHITIGGYYDGL